MSYIKLFHFFDLFSFVFPLLVETPQGAMLRSKFPALSWSFYVLGFSDPPDIQVNCHWRLLKSSTVLNIPSVHLCTAECTFAYIRLYSCVQQSVKLSTAECTVVYNRVYSQYSRHGSLDSLDLDWHHILINSKF